MAQKMLQRRMLQYCTSRFKFADGQSQMQVTMMIAWYLCIPTSCLRHCSIHWQLPRMHLREIQYWQGMKFEQVMELASPQRKSLLKLPTALDLQLPSLRQLGLRSSSKLKAYLLGTARL